MLLKNKVALITGASRGIGKAVALKFASEGANLALCSKTVNLELMNEIKEYSIKALYYHCDVSKNSAVNSMVAKIIEEFGRIDILCNIAGISPKSEDGKKIPFYNLNVEQWKEVMDINLNSMFFTSKAVIKYMMDNKYGKIINMSSIVGLTNSEHGPASAAYVTSKTGVIGLTRAMAYDLADFGINVNCIAAGRIATEMSAVNNQYYNDLHMKLIPMHRFGTPEEVAEVFLFYASDKSSYITGDVCNITGGWFI